MIYINPQFSLTKVRKIGKEFLKLVDHHFDKNYPYYKILNQNTIKLSYSCMENFKTEILNHNNKILNKPTLKKKEQHCNCRAEPCPLNKNCKQPKLQ